MSQNGKGEINEEQVIQEAAKWIKDRLDMESSDLPEGLRARVQRVLSPGIDPKEAERGESWTRNQLIDRLWFRDQYEIRADHMVYLIGKSVFKMGRPVPALNATMDSFSMEQLRLACDLQEPTLVLVPETGFRAKLDALNATIEFMRRMLRAQLQAVDGDADSPGWLKGSAGESEISRWNNARADGAFTRRDRRSEEVLGWRAVFADGACEMGLKENDNVGRTVGGRIKSRKANRKPSEKGMDFHTYAMLASELFGAGRMIDPGGIILMDEGPLLLEDAYVPIANGIDCNVDPSCLKTKGVMSPTIFSHVSRANIRKEARFRSVVGGDRML